MGCLSSILAGSEDTEERFGLMEMVAPRGREPSRHLHHSDGEGFYVLDGEVTFYVGEEIYRAEPGTFVFLPHGIPHSYTFETDVVRMLSFIAPGGLEVHVQDPRFSEPTRNLTLPTTGARTSWKRWAGTCPVKAPRWSVLPGRRRNSRDP